MPSLLREEEGTAFKQFKSTASQFLRDLERSDWGMLFAMQHFGLPTRLLDWTASFSCALFFANQEWDRETNAAVFALNPRLLNKKSRDIDGELHLDCHLGPSLLDFHNYHPGCARPDHTLKSIAVQPMYTNTRMVAQQSRFVICGDEFEPLEEEFGEEIVKYTITPTMAGDVDRFLALVGMDRANYYPDREGLALEVQTRQRDTLNWIESMVQKK